jgi:hypothetical protein
MFFENENGEAVTVTADRSTNMLHNVPPQFEEMESFAGVRLPQDTCHTARKYGYFA